MEEVVPICGEEWKMVEACHAVHHPGRDVPFLKPKCNSLHRLQIPTGNPNMPDEVCQAKRIKHIIELKADLGDGEEEVDLEEGYQHQQQGSPLWQPSQEQDAPGSGTTSASGRWTSPRQQGAWNLNFKKKNRTKKRNRRKKNNKRNKMMMMMNSLPPLYPLLYQLP